MKKKLFATLLIVFMVVGVLAACNKGGGGSSEGDFSDKTEYRSIYSADVGTLNYLNTTLTNDMYIPANCQDWLTEYDPYGNVIPSIAEKWDVSEDGLTWTFHLRDAKWVDMEGEEAGDVTAKDFVNAIEYAFMTDASAAYMLPAAKIEGTEEGAFDEDGKLIHPFSEVGVEAKDDKTLVFKLSGPCPYFITCMSYGCFAPMNEKTFQAVGDWDNRADWKAEDWDKFSEALDGVKPEQLLSCGPYYLSEYSAGERYTMKKNPSYWEADKVYIETISNIYNTEAATLSGEMYQRGEVEEGDDNLHTRKELGER
jgi:oligopeptide transport system substrate-binding protein